MEKILKKRMIGSQELFWGIFISAIFVWLVGLLDNNYIPCYINGVFFLLTVIITIVAYKKRVFATSFLFSFCARWFFIATIFPLGLVIVLPCDSTILFFIVIVFMGPLLSSILKESISWEEWITEYKNEGEINLKEGRFSILRWLSVWAVEKGKKDFWIALISSFLGVIIYRLLLEFLVDISKVVVVVAYLFLTSILSMKLGWGLFWLIRIIRLEKTLQIKFKTEFDYSS
jgi:hypothetical protein